MCIYIYMHVYINIEKMQSKRNCTGAVIHVCFTKKEEKKKVEVAIQVQSIA